MAATLGTAQVPARASGWRFAPPGVLFYLATGAAILVAVDANSRDSFSTFLVAAPIWLVLAAIWLVRFALMASRNGLRMSGAQWLRWLLVPVVMGSVFLITRTDALFDARLALSRGSMDQMASEVIGGGPMERGWVGLYNVGQVERTANGLRFVVDDSGIYRLGFAYSTDGEPSLTEDNYSPLWTGASYEPLGEGWWLWTEEWD